jgi:hypothetical protein
MWVFSSKWNFTIFADNGKVVLGYFCVTLGRVALANIGSATFNNWTRAECLPGFAHWIGIFVLWKSTVDVATVLVGALGLAVNALARVALGWIFVPHIGVSSPVTAAINTYVALWRFVGWVLYTSCSFAVATVWNWVQFTLVAWVAWGIHINGWAITTRTSSILIVTLNLSAKWAFIGNWHGVFIVSLCETSWNHVLARARWYILNWIGAFATLVTLWTLWRNWLLALGKLLTAALVLTFVTHILTLWTALMARPQLRNDFRKCTFNLGNW